MFSQFLGTFYCKTCMEIHVSSVTFLLCNSTFFLSCNPGWPIMLLTFFFAKMRTTATSKKDKIVTNHKIFTSLQVSFIIFLHGVNENLILVNTNSFNTLKNTTASLVSGQVLIKNTELLQNYFNTHGITVSCFSIFLLESQISFTMIILNDLILCKLDMIPNTIFSMHKVLTWSLKNR